MSSLECRVERLERSARRWRIAFGCLVVCVVGVAAGPAVQDVRFGKVVCSELQVVDKNGELRAIVTGEGSGGFSKVTIKSPVVEKPAVSIGVIDDKERGWAGMVLVNSSEDTTEILYPFAKSAR